MSGGCAENGVKGLVWRMKGGMFMSGGYAKNGPSAALRMIYIKIAVMVYISSVLRYNMIN
jgi:hypothetical protein